MIDLSVRATLFSAARTEKGLGLMEYMACVEIQISFPPGIPEAPTVMNDLAQEITFFDEIDEF